MQDGSQGTPDILQHRSGMKHEWQATPDSPPGIQTTPRFSGRAVAALVLAFVAILVSWIPFVHLIALGMSTVAIVQGMKGFRECNRNPHLKGAALAVIGTTIAAFALLISLVITIIIGIAIYFGGL